jgi:predicted RNA binding protein YcfA (HicA-like mRNA interferase family)
MPELRRISGQDAIKALEKLGFRKARQRGSHVVMKKTTPEGEIGCVVPMHHELAIGTLKGILRQAMVDKDEFIKHL